MRQLTEHTMQPSRLKCTDCDIVGLAVRVRRQWGVAIPEIPFCEPCWKSRLFAYFNHAPWAHADGRV